MSTTLLVIIISVVAVGIFVLAMSLTLIFKGHHIDSEIGDNKNMKARGIECAAKQIRNEEAVLRGEKLSDEECDQYGCGSCTIGDCINSKTEETEKKD